MNKDALFYTLENAYPASAGYEGDFFGLQTGEVKEEIKTIVLCLDFDNDVFNKIKKYKVDLIITHHPLIYGERNEVLEYDYVKRKLVEKIDSLGIPVYSMHTNFDGAFHGMNDALARKIGLINIHQIQSDKLARAGELKNPMNVVDFAKMVKEKLNLPSVYLINRGKKMVKNVALCGGSGSGIFRQVQEEGYDIYLSGDAPHNIRHDINCYHFNYLEIMHEVEQIFIPTVYKLLKKVDPKLKIICISQDYPTFY